MSDEQKNTMIGSLSKNMEAQGVSLLARQTLKDFPELVKDNPEMFEGVRAIGKINLAYSIAVYVWKYYKARYDNRPEIIGFDEWIKQEAGGGQED